MRSAASTLERAPKAANAAEEWAIRLVGVPDEGYACRIVNPWEGYYLLSYDPDARAGLGEAVFTQFEHEAKRFGSFEDAKACWFQQSTELPRRAIRGADVENRPLAVCDVSIDPI